MLAKESLGGGGWTRHTRWTGRTAFQAWARRGRSEERRADGRSTAQTSQAASSGREPQRGAAATAAAAEAREERL
jgi:hypothetical protein